MISFTLDHDIDFTPGAINWLSYSHDRAPAGRPIITGYQDPTRPAIRMATHYFLTDYADKLLPSGYKLIPIPGQKWTIEISDHSEAAMFKLVFL